MPAARCDYLKMAAGCGYAMVGSQSAQPKSSVASCGSLGTRPGQKPGQQSGTGDDALEIQPLVGPVGVAADRARPSIVGSPAAAVVLASPAPSGSRLADLEPEVAGDPLSLGDQRGHGQSAFHGQMSVGRQQLGVGAPRWPT